MKHDKNYKPSLLGIACIAIVAFAWSVLRAPAALGGKGLGVLVGLVRNPYVLTSVLPTHVQSLHFISAVFIALNVAAVGFGAASLASRSRTVVGIVSAGIFAFSPFALVVVADPLGPGLGVSLLLFLGMLFDVLRIASRVPLAVQCLISFAASLHDGALLLPTLVYCALAGHREGKRSLVLMLFSALFGSAARTMLLRGGGVYPHGSFAQPLTAIGSSLILFIILPIALFAAKKGWYEKVALGGRGGFPALALAASMALSGVFAFGGDPSAYWLAGESALILVAVSKLQWNETAAPRVAAMCATALFFFSIVLHSLLAPALASQVASEEANAVRNAAITTPDLSRNPVCVSGADLKSYDPLAGGAFFKVYGFSAFPVVPRAIDCINRQPLPSSVIVLENARIRIVDAHAMALVEALRQQQTGTRLGLNLGTLTPKTSIQVPGHGAFVDGVNTELGSAPSVTVIAGFAYTVRCSVRQPAHLTFAAANPLAGSPRIDPVRFDVQMIWNRHRTSLIAKTLSPDSRAASPTWTYYSVSIPHRKGCSQLRFAASAPPGHSMATWVTFVAPTLR